MLLRSAKHLNANSVQLLMHIQSASTFLGGIPTS